MALSEAADARAAADSTAAGDEIARAPTGGGVPQAPEEAVEAQLRTILEATQTAAGAVCLFDQHQELLRLAVEVGLSDEGCRRLRNIRRGSATTWDMPLHSLLNRRAYLIESAAKNRYVPPLVDDVAAVRTVACIPLFDGQTPVGSLILVTLAPKTFGERQIRVLEQPTRDLVKTIGDMRKRVSQAGPSAPTRPRLSARSAPLPPVSAGPMASSPIQDVVDRTRTEIERLRTRVAEAEETAGQERARAASLEQQLRDLEARAAETQKDLERLHTAFAERSTEHQALVERAGVLETALESARATESALRDDLQQATQAQTAHDTTTTAERLAALDESKARVAALETEVAALRVRVAELETANQAFEADTRSREHTASSEADARTAAALREAEAQAASSVAEAEARAAEAHSKLAEIEARAATRLAEAEAAVAEAEARAAAAVAGAAEWRERSEAAEGEVSSTRIASASQKDQVDALARERERVEAELAAGREREAALEARIAELQAESDASRQEGVQLRSGFAHLESLIQVGVDAGSVASDAEIGFGEGGGGFEVVELDGASDASDVAGAPISVEMPALEVTRSGIADPLPDAPPVAEALAPAQTVEGLVVLDADDVWTGAAPSKDPIITVAPGDAVVDAVARENRERLLVNLAAPGSLAALAAIREAGITTPAFGCIAVPGKARGLALGRFEIATRPIDPDALLATLQGSLVRGTRVVTAGADVDGLISLRQALARLGVSVSMAWDAKQVGDLLHMVHPEVAIIDLDLPPKDGCAVVARLALTPPVPMTVVVPKSDDSARAFVTAVSHPELERNSIPAKELLARILAQPLKAAKR